MVKVRLLVSVLLVCLAVAFLPSTAWAVDFTPTGCTADKELSADYVCSKVYSDSDGYPWASTNATGVLTVDFGQVRQVTSYQVMGRALSGGLTQAPKDWTVWGSTDNTNWTQVDAVASATGWAATEKRTYAVDTPGGYRYYQYRFTANNGDSLLAVDWMSWSGADAPATTTTVTSTSTATVTATATATVTAMPTTMSLDSNQYGVLILCGAIIMLGSVVSMIVGWRR